MTGMTGKQLIMAILNNNLLNEPVVILGSNEMGIVDTENRGLITEVTASDEDSEEENLIVIQTNLAE